MRMLVQAVLFALITASSVNALAGLSGDEKKELHRLDQSFQDLPQSDNSAKLTLASILHEGSLANPALKKAFYEWKAAVQQITQARSLEDPQFTFKQFLNEVETRVGPQRQAFAVMQEIPFPGKLYERGKAATAEARQKYADFEKVRLTTVYELKDVFFVAPVKLSKRGVQQIIKLRLRKDEMALLHKSACDRISPPPDTPTPCPR